uniref:Uncharacterized protein n=1 Tax=Oryza rufipogon TaxID=4529 RepID=A0A0E0PDD8_ORYRU
MCVDRSPTTAPRTAAALPSARFICASSRQLVQIAAAAVDRKGKLREKIERSKAPSSSAATQSKSAKGSTRDKPGEEKIPSATGDRAKQSRVKKFC